jgi:hypothetical protein
MDPFPTMDKSTWQGFGIYMMFLEWTAVELVAWVPEFREGQPKLFKRTVYQVTVRMNGFVGGMTM